MELIAQWLERRPSNTAVVRLNPGRRRTYVPVILRPRAFWQIKAMPGMSYLKKTHAQKQTTTFARTWQDIHTSVSVIVQSVLYHLQSKFRNHVMNNSYFRPTTSFS